MASADNLAGGILLACGGQDAAGPGNTRETETETAKSKTQNAQMNGTRGFRGIAGIQYAAGDAVPRKSRGELFVIVITFASNGYTNQSGLGGEGGQG